MDLQQRITRRLRADYDATRVNATVTIDAAAKLAALEAEDSDGYSQTRLRYEASARTPNGLRPLVLAEPDLQALTAAGLQIPGEPDVQRPVTPAGEPAVVVGGRYVVGENPTYRGTSGVVPFPVGGWPGRVVKVIDGPDSFGDVQVDGGVWIDPRHLTPAPEPAAAPAVDDELLRDLNQSLRKIGLFQQSKELWELTADRLQEGPWQRLRAAWIEAERNAADANWDREVKRIERERDELRTERDDLRSQLEAESTVQWAHRDTIEHLNAEVELLRTAQPSLPDVGPVTRDSDKLWVNGCVYWDRFTAETWRKDGAERLALAAFLDAEAATSSDDEVDPLDKPVRHYLDILTSGTSVEFGGSRPWKLRNMDGLDAEERQVMPDAMTVTFDDAHRARGGQEAGRG